MKHIVKCLILGVLMAAAISFVVWLIVDAPTISSGRGTINITDIEGNVYFTYCGKYNVISDRSDDSSIDILIEHQNMLNK